jgi:hypothetical protein
MCSWEDIDSVITDDCIERSYIEFFENRGISTIMVNTPAENGDV